MPLLQVCPLVCQGKETRMMREMKDRAIVAALTPVIAEKLKDFGTLQDLALDSAARSITASILLNGEDRAVTLVASSYSLEESDEKMVLKVEKIRVSREWMRVLADRFMPKPFILEIPLPDGLKGFLARKAIQWAEKAFTGR